jgi:hypothetical protein
LTAKGDGLQGEITIYDTEGGGTIRFIERIGQGGHIGRENVVQEVLSETSGKLGEGLEEGTVEFY